MPIDSLSERQHKNFWMCFRIPLEHWKEMVEELNENELFKRWHRGNKDPMGRLASPIELLTLGVLRVLGRGECFDSLEESTFISSKVHRAFFKKFMSF